MDLTEPIRSVVPTLDGPVLRALASTTTPVTGRRVWRMAGTGSEAGVRLCLGRLVDQGLVTAIQAGQAWLYTGNRQHVAWPAVELLADLRTVFRERLTHALVSWVEPPLVAGLFGSTARADGGPSSDVDVLLIRPGSSEVPAPAWGEQVAGLVRDIRSWTGNSASVFDVDRERALEIIRGDDLGASWTRDLDVLLGQETWLDLVHGTGAA